MAPPIQVAALQHRNTVADGGLEAVLRASQIFGAMLDSVRSATPVALKAMKSLLLFVPLLVAAAHAASSAAPVSPTPSAASDLQAVFVDPAAPEVAEIRTLGERAINRVGVSMVSEVKLAVAKDGPEKAVEVCHLKALPMTGKVIDDMPRITAVKRTSLQLRNPANAPDAADQLALRKVQLDIERGENPPKVLVQRIDLPGAAREWRVYRPIGVAQQCVVCHGERENLSPGLRQRLEERYPNDQATGYTIGQWRGLIRVTVAEASPPAKAPSAAPKAPAGKAAKKS